ncbi:MAG TPA: 50S ribosomal protein L25/general stress protein Ctc [Gammaproteobacteria bacterium]|nr:50S ribosomal protein L25/general stress protein Ctc [Gammaproteobacteria bacterium]
MAISFTLTAEVRNDQGKGASRRLRRAGKVPGILYGAHKEPQLIAFDHHELERSLKNEAFYSHILTIKVGGEEQQAIVKDVQRHPAKPQITHIDLQRVSEHEEIRVHVPLHFINEGAAIGVKQQGGVISHNLIEVEVACLPRYLPEYIEVDVKDLELGKALHLSDLKLPEGVRLVALSHGPEHDLPVVAIHHARVTTEADLAPEAPTTAEVPTVQDEKKAEKAAAETGAKPEKK